MDRLIAKKNKSASAFLHPEIIRYLCLDSKKRTICVTLCDLTAQTEAPSLFLTMSVMFHMMHRHGIQQHRQYYRNYHADWLGLRAPGWLHSLRKTHDINHTCRKQASSYLLIYVIILPADSHTGTNLISLSPAEGLSLGNQSHSDTQTRGTYLSNSDHSWSYFPVYNTKDFLVSSWYLSPVPPPTDHSSIMTGKVSCCYKADLSKV